MPGNLQPGIQQEKVAQELTKISKEESTFTMRLTDKLAFTISIYN